MNGRGKTKVAQSAQTKGTEMKMSIPIALIALVWSCQAHAMTEVQRLEQEYANYGKQLQYWQNEYNLRVGEYGRAIQAYNNAVATRQSQAQVARQQQAVNQSKFRCDHAQESISSTKLSMQYIGKMINEARKREYEQQRAEQQRRWQQELARKQSQGQAAQEQRSSEFQLAADLTRNVELLRVQKQFEKPMGIAISANVRTQGQWQVEIRTPGLYYSKMVNGTGTVTWSTTTQVTSLTGRSPGNKVQVWVKDLSGNGRVPNVGASIQVITNQWW